MPVDDSAGQSPLGDPDQGGSGHATSGQSGSDRGGSGHGAAGSAAPGFRAGPAETGDGVDGGAARGIWLTASTWVPEDLIEALRRCEPGSEGGYQRGQSAGRQVHQHHQRVAPEACRRRRRDPVAPDAGHSRDHGAELPGCAGSPSSACTAAMRQAFCRLRSSSALVWA